MIASLYSRSTGRAVLVKRGGQMTVALSLLSVLVVLAGCGSKPAFCSHVSELENSIKALGNLNAQSGISGLEATLAKIDTSAKAVVSSAKSEFPTQTAAIEKSVSAVGTSAKEVANATSTQARTAAISKLPAQVSAVNTAFSEFSNATKAKCK